MALPDWLNRSAGTSRRLAVFAAAGQVGTKQSPLQLFGGRAEVEKADFFLATRGFPSSYVII